MSGRLWLSCINLLQNNIIEMPDEGRTLPPRAEEQRIREETLMGVYSNNHPIHRELISTDPHYASLVRRKQELDGELAEEMNHVSVDWDGVKLIKRKKLALMEQLDDYRRHKGTIN
jgi:hypothetical protein